MDWSELFTLFLVSHLVGDFLLQTDWQASHKHRGLQRGRPQHTRALLTHATTYVLAFVPALVALGAGDGALWIGAGIFLTHLIQDDGRLVSSYVRHVKRLEPRSVPVVDLAVDQTLHLVVLLGLAALAGG